ncbi:MAG: proton-conducting transporter membrane subunit [Clostridia bacterium]
MSVLLFVCVFLPMLMAPIAWLLGRRSHMLMDACTVAISLLVFVGACACAARGATAEIPGFCGLGVRFQVEGFRSVLWVLCAAVFPLSALSAHAYFVGGANNGRYQAFFLLTFGALMGVFASDDLFTTYVFFEMMSLSSWVWIAQNETDESRKAADTYLAIAVIGGLVMLYGLFTLQQELGTLMFSALRALRGASLANPRVLVAGFCLLLGFGAKAGMYPLHIWLPKAHPVAPAPASALLSGILTKGGIFGILICVSGLYQGDVRFALVILVLGIVTMLLGALLALVSNDLKRTLACSSLSQIGFILVACALIGLGKETTSAAGGAVLHMVNHAFIKLILFVSAGAIYKRNHTLDLNRLRGAGRGNLPLMACFIVGSLSIAGIPGFGGYVSKSLIHQAIVENMAVSGAQLSALLSVTEWLFLLSGGMTLAYMGKLFVRLFVEKGDCCPIKLDTGTALAIGVPSVLLLIAGLIPNRTYERIANVAADSLGAGQLSARYFSIESLQGAAISIIIGALLYVLVVRLLLTDRKTGYDRVVPTLFSIENNMYRPLLQGFAFFGALVARTVYCMTDWTVLLMKKVLMVGAFTRWNPGKDDHFAHYSRKYVQFGRIPQTLAFELMLFGIGVVITLLYLLI